MTPTFEEIASSGGHKDATMHVGGHGEPWPDLKVLVITKGERTYVCIRRDGEEQVLPVDSVREGLRVFADYLRSAVEEMPDGALTVGGRSAV